MSNDVDQRAAALYLLKLKKAALSFPGFMQYYYPDMQFADFQEELQEVLDLLEKDALVTRGGNPVRNLLINMPPRHAKSFNSTINLPAYSLMRRPEREIMVSAYNAELASTFGRATREIVTDQKATKPFSRFDLSKESRAVDFWKTQAGGAYYAVGLNGTTTGRGASCLTGDTEILATTGRGATIATTIEAIVNSQEPINVLAYDHKTGAPAWGRAYAFSATKASEIYVIRLADGTVLRASSEHPIYVSGRGYVEAKGIAAGDLVVRVLQEGHAEAGVRDPEGEEEGPQGLLLLSGVQQEPSRREEHATMRHVRGTGEAEWHAEVLQRGVQVRSQGGEESGNEAEEHEAVPAVPQDVQPTEQRVKVLFDELQKYASLAINDGSRESTTDARRVCGEEAASHDQGLHEGEAEDSGEGRNEVRCVRIGEKDSRSPHRPQRHELRVVKSCDALPDLSQQAPQAFRQTRYTAVSSVERVREDCFVYNLSVEGFENFFANGVLTHNCLIIDDPYKSREEADSASSRRKVWDFYTAGLLSRMQPDRQGQPAFQIVTHTRWHPDDMTGRIMESPEYKRGEWHHLNFQALTERAKKRYTSRAALSKDDERHIPRITNEEAGAEGDPDGLFIPVGARTAEHASRVLESAGELTSLWPKRFDVDWLLKQKAVIGEREFAALYQQSPYIVGGNVLKTSWLKRYDPLELPEMHALAVAVDTAFKARTSSDYSVFSVGGITTMGDIYLMKVIREKLEFPDLKRKAIAINAAYRGQGLRGFWVEDKASGQSLIQELRNDSGVPVIPWKTGTDDKVARANSITPLIEAGRVFVPEDADWLDEWLSEISAFPSVKHDDQVDSFVMLIDVLSRMVVSGMKDFSAPLGSLVGVNGDISADSGLLFSNMPLAADPGGWMGKGGFGSAMGQQWKGWGE